jgi:hypothetical protein
VAISNHSMAELAVEHRSGYGERAGARRMPR